MPSKKAADQTLGRVFDPTIDQFNGVIGPTSLINEMLIGSSNTIRPSLAFEIAMKFIDDCIQEGVPEFVDHEAAWKEASILLQKLHDKVADLEIDNQYAMLLEPFEWDVDDIFALYGRIISGFRSNYIAYTTNRNSDSFGDLTVAECLKLLFFPFRNALAPASSWRYGHWKSRSPLYPRTWDTWPWADYYFTKIRETYTDLEDALGQSIPGGSFPWSMPG